MFCVNLVTRLKVRRYMACFLLLGEGWRCGAQHKLDRDNQDTPKSLGQIQEGSITQWVETWALNLGFAPL